ncbi:unnamed protein product [Ceratitis capitata]|uniref:(Mediterranean fruit fly) hypothetical protein n=1 Tax=Ceratitis capitata TaxID=7213 RepID=A0A811UI84_CERCA|nr:unnamed protein product [Ceratitis capitata]
MTLEEFQYFSLLEEKRPRYDIPHSDECLDENVELVCAHERFAVAARQYQTNNSKLKKKIDDLEKEIKDLNERNTFWQTKTTKTHMDASADTIVFAKNDFEDEKSRYTEEEKNLAQNINYISSKAYTTIWDSGSHTSGHL